MRSILCSAVVFFGVLLAGHAAESKPNVVFILMEDLYPRFGCYGNEQVKTPNIDKLASEGMLFTNAHCQYAVCNPSRTSFLSGLRPATTKGFNNGDDPNKTLPKGSTIPEVFRAQGYKSFGIGKIFHDDRGAFKSDWRWDYSVFTDDLLEKPNPKKKTILDNVRAKLDPKNKLLREVWGWMPLDEEDAETREGQIARKAAEILKEKHDKPIFMMVGLHSTHTDWVAPKKYFDMYPPEKIVLNDTIYPKDDLEDTPKGRYGGKVFSHDLISEQKRKEAIAGLYAVLSFADAQVGVVLDALKESGLDKNTHVILISDHGLHTGEHFLWQKRTFFDEGTRVPFIVRSPGVTSANTRSDAPVELIDILPTLADLCGIQAPKNVEGISMVPLLKNPALEWKKAAFTYMTSGPNSTTLSVTIRTRDFRYSEWEKSDVKELYDMKKDPHQIHNVVNKPEYKSTVEELHKILAADWQGALPKK